MIERVKTSKAAERAIPDVIQAAGASTSIRRTSNVKPRNIVDQEWKVSMKETRWSGIKKIVLTMTPEKYTDVAM